MGLKKLNSEYNSRYKTFAVHRPVTTKAKILSHPLDSAPEALESSRRAGLLSNQFSNISEPALQRKRIVPYKHNHNILSTTTVKELNDKDWLEAVGNDAGEKISTANNVKRKDMMKTEDTEYTSSFARQKEKDSPVILASKEKIKQKSQEEKRQTARSTAPRRPSLEKSPERMPPAGMPTYIADPQDKRLLRPCDDLLYPAAFQENNRNSQTEYTERYIGSIQGREYVPDPKREESSNIDLATYKKVLQQRNDAYGLATRPGTSPVKQRSSNPTQKHSRLHNARRSSNDSKTTSSYISEGKEKELRKTYLQPKRKQKDEKFMTRAPEHTKISPRRSDEESLSSIRSANDLKAKRNLKKEVKHTVYENKVQQSKNKNLYAESVSSRSSRSSYNEHDHVKEKLIPANTRSKNEKYLKKRSNSEEESVSSVYSTRCFENTTSRKRNAEVQTENRSVGITNKTRGHVVSKEVTRGSARIRRDTKKSHQDILDRGRSPTPEMRTAGQSRRHHLDVTTGSNNPLATGPDPRQTKVLRSLNYERASYDPSRYSDAGDSLISSHSLASWSDSGPQVI